MATKVKKAKDLIKLKRAEGRERETRSALRLLCGAARIEYPGDTMPLVEMIERVLVPRVRALVIEAVKTGAVKAEGRE
jgi:hypothetical protein